MGHLPGLHVLSPEESRTMPLPALLAVGGAFAGIVIAGTLARMAIEFAKGAGDAAKGLAEGFIEAWTGAES